ncbi:MAG: Thioredoxin [uncultured Thiotrichaceae bacterium]|uniref:Thioredoxin n=1 Tax=uncultured Thiotrichaceae bacterium TaxID=298394 RepID=A0A6S6TSF7_9GAMM|nr:MAG: Thioredoxin [uncultured Thiotrichaceae bacterium]
MKHFLSLLLILFSSCAIAIESSQHDSQDVIQQIDDAPKERNNQYPDWFSMSFLNLQEDLASANKAGKKGLIVYFGQKDCGYCKALLEINWGKEQDIVDYTRKHFEVVAIDIWGSREITNIDGNHMTEREFAEQEETDFTPTLIFYTNDGKESLRLRGFHPPYQMQAAMEYIAEGFHEKETLATYMERANPPAKFELDDINEEDFFDKPPYLMDRSHFPADQPLAVFFEQRACHSCDILHSEPLQDPIVRRQLRSFDVIQLDMYSDVPLITPDNQKLTAAEWAKKLGLHYTPTIIFFDIHGEEVFRVDSVVRLYRMRGVLEYVLKEGYNDAPTFQRWREMQQQNTLENQASL